MLNPSLENASLVWWDGQLLPASEARLPAISQGHLWGRGLFETIAVRHGQPFSLARHLARLRAGAVRLALQPPDEATFLQAIDAILTDCPPQLHRLRITLTGAETPGLTLTPEPGHLLIQLTPVLAANPIATLLTVPWRRNEWSALSGLKATSYAENALALDWAQARGATEALFLNTAGHLCEGSVSNIFMVQQGVVLTPPLTSGCLPGITRALVLECCVTLGLPSFEKILTPAHLATAEEVFITNSLHGILPVQAVDLQRYFVPCPLTTQLAAGLHLQD